MKRFYKDVTSEKTQGGWRVTLDGRPVKTQKGSAQIVPSAALASAMAAEWAAQGEDLDPSTLPLRDMADVALDVIAADPAAEVASILRFGETDTLCYRAEPGDALFERQEQLWEPLLTKAEARHGVRFERISGVIHRAQPEATLSALRGMLEGQDAFTLSALKTLSSLAASLVVALEALEDDADAEALWASANAEEDWQAELWGWEEEARERRDRKQAEFARAMEFLRLARAG